MGYVFMIGSYPRPLSLPAGHVAEETHSSHLSTPWAMVLAAGNALVLGLVLIIGINSCIQNYDDLLSSATKSHSTYVILWEQTVGPQGAIIFLIILFVGIECSNCANLTSASRMIYALSRDGAMPCSRALHKLDPRFGGPVRSIWLAILLCFIVALLGLASDAVLSALFSLTATGLYTSYLIPILLRVTGEVEAFQPSEWNLGSFSYPLSCFSVVWCAFMVVILCLPTSPESSIDTFNYSPIALGSVLFISVVVWFVYARFWFKGAPSNLPSKADKGGVSSDNLLTLTVEGEDSRAEGWDSLGLST